VTLDDLEHAGKVLSDLAVPEPDHAVAPELDFACASQICLLMSRVLSTIDFDGEPAGRAGEIDHVAPDRVLAAEALVRKRLTESPPQAFLDFGRIAP
jgi:hypothetical protein